MQKEDSLCDSKAFRSVCWSLHWHERIAFCQLTLPPPPSPPPDSLALVVFAAWNRKKREGERMQSTFLFFSLLLSHRLSILSLLPPFHLTFHRWRWWISFLLVCFPFIRHKSQGQSHIQTHYFRHLPMSWHQSLLSCKLSRVKVSEKNYCSIVQMTKQ